MAQKIPNIQSLSILVFIFYYRAMRQSLLSNKKPIEDEKDYEEAD